MQNAHVALGEDDGIGVLRIDRPPANAIDLGVARELVAITERLASSEMRAIVLTGAGTCFSAGADVKAVPSYGREEQREMILAINRFVAALYACPLPVVAAVNGHALGGGLCIALCADARVCTNAPLSAPAARVLTLRALPIDPETALAMRVVDELHAPDALVARAAAIARRSRRRARSPTRATI
jgi:enoyl-CoA hydratase